MLTTEEKQHLDRIGEKLDDTLTLLNETRIAVARIESREVCGKPNMCVDLQNVLKDHERRISHQEAILQWAAGVTASAALLSFVCWDMFKLWIKK